MLREEVSVPLGNPDPNFWKGRKVLITGHTGFKGSWLCAFLRLLGAEVTGYALDPPTQPAIFDDLSLARHVNDLRGDIRDEVALDHAFGVSQPEVVFHLAAQALVLESYRNPIETLDTNVTGTARVLLAARRSEPVRAVVNVTTDKCYRNPENAEPFTEAHHLGGNDVYSASKACSELVTDAIRHSFFHLEGRATRLGTARAGNVIGGGDWADDRLVPDAIRAFTNGAPLVIRHPEAVRPWQHVLEPLTGYLLLAEALATGAPGIEGPWNFGPDAASCWNVGQVAETLGESWRPRGVVEVQPGPQGRESQLLQLDSSKARDGLRWHPRLDLRTALQWTVDWYRAREENEDLYALTQSQVRAYLEPEN